MASFFSFVLPAPRSVVVACAALAGVLSTASAAGAVSLRVQLACATDYYAHCSAYSPSSPQVRSCMRAVGAGLSKRCVSALISAGEVSAGEVARRGRLSETAAR
jgi:hypothetical protein